MRENAHLKSSIKVRLYAMATQLADRGPNPDLWSGKFGPRPTTGPKLGPGGT